MDAREFTWKLSINPKADFVSSRIWKDDIGDAMADEGVYDNYQFRSCLRLYLLVKTPIGYPKTASKPSPKACASRRCVRNQAQVTPISIAACARKQGDRGLFDTENKPRKSQNGTFLRLGAFA